MNRGGVETWLLDVLRRLPRNEVAIDFMVHTEEPGAYDDDAVALGATIHRNVRTRTPLRYGIHLRRLLRATPRYDIVHSHVYHYSGLVLATAALARVPVRVAHSHTDTRPMDRSGSLWRRAYERLGAHLIQHTATDGFACSDGAGRSLFGERWAEDPRWSRLDLGLDPRLYTGHADRHGVRAEWAVPADASVMIHVGRFDAAKNQSFAVDVLAALARRRADAVLILVGTGPLESLVADRAVALGVRERVRFCGSRADVPRLLGAADVFVFPSLLEGLPLTCLEAQASGLPVVMADTITDEVIVAADRVWRVPLGDPDAWATAVVTALALPAPARDAIETFGGGPFDIAVSTRMLLEFYRRALSRADAGHTRLDPSPHEGRVNASPGGGD